jgi:predicted transcriptional regulator
MGVLERAVMDLLWSTEDALTVRQLADSFPDHAYTTILTVCDRLAKKGFVTRVLDGRSHVYRPSATREEYVAQLMDSALSGSDDRAAVLVRFVSAMDDEEAELLRAALRRRPR